MYFNFKVLNLHKKPSGVRYNQWTIKFSVIIHGRSPSLYALLRDEKILTLPSVNTLLSYTGTSSGKVGMTDPMKRRIKMIADGLDPKERRVSIQMDEIHLKQLLLYVNTSQRLVGEVDYGEVDLERGKKYNQPNNGEVTTVNKQPQQPEPTEASRERDTYELTSMETPHTAPEIPNVQLNEGGAVGGTDKVEEPTESFTGRLWTVYQFVDCVLPSISDCSHIKDDLVEFLLPKILVCADLKCGRKDTKNAIGQINLHNTEILRHALKKFISPIIKNYGQSVSDVCAPLPVTYNKPAKRKALKLN